MDWCLECFEDFEEGDKIIVLDICNSEHCLHEKCFDKFLKDKVRKCTINKHGVMIEAEE